jgi:UDP:flavonoid glycosyltransferase YjiC (YdhE family)
MTHDQPDNAARVKRLGVGEVLPWKGITAKRMQTALQQLLSDPDLHARVQSLAEKVNCEDGLAEAATEIEKMQVK